MNLDIMELNSRYKPVEFQTENNSNHYLYRMEWNHRFSQLLAESGLSVPKVAEALGRKDDQPFIERLQKYKPQKNGKHVKNPRSGEIEALAKVFGVSPSYLRDGGPRHVATPNASVGEQVKFARHKTIPVYGKSAGGKEGKFLLNGQTVADLLCPPSLEAVPNAYAVRIEGDSMIDRYEDGETVLVSPARPYRKGHYVVVQLKTDDPTVFEGFAKRFISFNSKELVLEQLNPPQGHDRIMRFPADRVETIHKIVGPDGY